VKITFEGKTYGELLDQMAHVLAVTSKQSGTFAATASKNVSEDQGPGPEAVSAPPQIVENPVEKSAAKSAAVPEGGKKARTAKQLENDERLRERALAKKAAGLKVGDKAPKAPKAAAPVEKPLPPPPATAESLGLDPAEVVNIRQKTINDLQEAYANGHQQEVFDLLSRFGNGAKSFRELPPDAFVPIREAIDNGALT
jgi:hypothetical protein